MDGDLVELEEGHNQRRGVGLWHMLRFQHQYLQRLHDNIAHIIT